MLINSAPRGFVLVDASAKTPTWRRYSRGACLPDQARGGYRGGVAGAPWWLRHSCYPTLLASQLALQLARPSRRNSVHKCPKTATRGHFHQSVYTSLSPRSLSRSYDRSAGRFLEQRALPLGGERVGVKRSGSSGSAIGTLGPEWQCHPHEAARSRASDSTGPGDLRADGRCAQCRDAPQEESSRALPGTVPP